MITQQHKVKRTRSQNKASEDWLAPVPRYWFRAVRVVRHICIRSIEIIRILLPLKQCWTGGRKKKEERKLSRSGRGRKWKKKDGREENKTRQRFPIYKLTSITATKLSVISVHKSNIVFLTSIVAVWKQLKFPTSFSHSFRKRQDISN